MSLRPTSGLPAARAPRTIDLASGDAIDLRIGPVATRVGDATVRMLGYDVSVPGPTLRVEQGSEVTVHVLNEGDLDATVHWHGLPLDNPFDGTTETQRPMSNAGRWMAHCHIAEHHESGMMLAFDVDPASF